MAKIPPFFFSFTNNLDNLAHSFLVLGVGSTKKLSSPVYGV
jgi:hypothetical protein